jgi:hypothetical protein
MNKITLDIPKFNFKSPSPLTLKEFGVRFSQEEWSQLCSNKEFMNIILEDVSVAEVMARKVLEKK